MAQKSSTKTLIPVVLALTLGFASPVSAEYFEKVEKLIMALNSPNQTVICSSLQHELDLTNLNIYYLKEAIKTTPSREAKKLSIDLNKLIKLRLTLTELLTLNHCI